MDIALKKLDLVQRLLQIWDEAAIERVAKAIESEAPEADDIEDDLEELDRRRERQLKGESRSFSREEAMKLARSGFKR